MIKFSDLKPLDRITIVDNGNKKNCVSKNILYSVLDGEIFNPNLKFYNDAGEEIYIDKIPFEYLLYDDKIIVVNNKTKAEKVTDVDHLGDDLVKEKLNENDFTFYLGYVVGDEINFYALMADAIARELQLICNDHKNIDFAKIANEVMCEATDEIDYALRHGHETCGDFQSVFEDALCNYGVYKKMIEVII